MNKTLHNYSHAMNTICAKNGSLRDYCAMILPFLLLLGLGVVLCVTYADMCNALLLIKKGGEETSP